MEHNLYYAVGPNCWGTGKTQLDAIKRTKQNLFGLGLIAGSVPWTSPDDAQHISTLGGRPRCT